MKKKLKVLVLFDGTSPTSLDQDFSKEMKTKDWKTEADVMAALGAVGHTAEHLAIFDDVDLLRQKLETFAPDVLFNLVEQFRNNPGFDQNIVSFFEMQGRPFTGCGSTGLKRFCTITESMCPISSSFRAASASGDRSSSSFRS